MRLRPTAFGASARSLILAAFPDAIAQVVELGPAHVAQGRPPRSWRWSGECTGKVRSTPTPKLTLRTVKVSRTPGALAADDRALEDLDPLPGALDHPDVHLDGVAGAEVGDVVAQAVAIDRCRWGAWGASFRRRTAGSVPDGTSVAVLGQDRTSCVGLEGDRSLEPPGASSRSGRRSAVRRQRHWARRQASTIGRGRPSAAPRAPPSPGTRPAGCSGGTRAGPIGEALLVGRVLVAQHAGEQPGDRLDHHQGGQLPAGQHEVAHRELAVDQMVGHPLVDPLVTAAQQREPPGRGRPAPSGRRLVEAPAARARAAAAGGAASAARSTAAKTGSGIEHHAGPATEGSVVDRAARVRGRRRAGRARRRSGRPNPGPDRGCEVAQ